MLKNKITLKMQTIFEGFFDTYVDIHSHTLDMDKKELSEYLDGDIFVACVSAATGIPECDFAEYAVKHYYKKHSRKKIGR